MTINNPYRSCEEDNVVSYRTVVVAVTCPQD